MQKMARDRLKQFGQDATADFSESELVLCDTITKAMAIEVAASGDRQAAWNSSWRDIYSLADAVMDNVQVKFMSASH
jgi:hypothetical protein